MLKLNRLPNDRPVDRWPAGRTTGPTDKVTIPDVQGRVQVAVRTMRTSPTVEPRTLSVAALDVAADEELLGRLALALHARRRRRSLRRQKESIRRLGAAAAPRRRTMRAERSFPYVLSCRTV